VVLEFHVQEPAAIRGAFGTLPDRDLNDLVHFSFIAPVEFQIGGIGLFSEHSPDPCDWLEVPLFSIALTLSEVVNELAQGLDAAFDPDEFGDVIFMTHEGGQILVRSELTGARVRVALDDLAAAARSFSARLTAFLSRAYPELLDHRELGPWLRGEVANPFDV
jgi:hypothetical protein